MVVIMWLYTFIKTHRIVHLNLVNFIVMQIIPQKREWASKIEVVAGKSRE